MKGRRVAAAEICLLGEAGAEGTAEAGIEALGLSLAAGGAAGQKPGALSSRLSGAGASLELKPLGREALCLELVAPTEKLKESLADLAAALAKPAFVEGKGPTASEFAAARRSLEMAALRRESDPAQRAGQRLDAELHGGPSESVLGSSRSLGGLDERKTIEHWGKHIRSERFRIVVVGDLDPDDLAAALAPFFASMPVCVPSASPTEATLTGPQERSSWVGKSIIEAAPEGGQSYLAAAFPAPRASSPESAALCLALSILEDSLQGELEGASIETGLDEAAAPSGYMAIRGAFSPAAARAGVERAIARLSGGSEELLQGQAFEACRQRALARTYAREDSASALARRIALDLASGGDGLSYFRLGEGILAAGPEDVSRAARTSLARTALVWAAAARAEELASFSALDANAPF
jgi:predicted Zn-dependent peptidase